MYILYFGISASDVKCASGGPIIPLNHRSGRWSNLFLDLQFNCSGYLTKLKFYAYDTGDFIFATWRQLEVGTYTLMNQIQVTASHVGYCVSILSTDRLH